MKYWLPSKDDGENPVEYNAKYNSVIVVGGNGAGKSKLGAWIEQQKLSLTHRIAAQRSLVFNPNADIMAYDKAENIVISGYHAKRDDRMHKWDWRKDCTTKLVDDFDASLAAIVAMKNDQLDAFYADCIKAETNGHRPDPPRTKIEELKDIWKLIFPQRRLIFKSSRFYALKPDAPETEKYSALEMSDGERSVLYLAAQILSLDHGRIIIVDEPETHLHGSIMLNLWTALERARPDCLFVYITHDLDFAACHSSADKYWIKSYDGKVWDYEKIDDIELPQELLFEILGSRKNVLFVEGTRGSLDRRLYSLLFPSVHIIPCGSCTEVVEYTKAFSACSALTWCKVKGLIDRDYRSEHEITANMKDGIYTLKVAEVENLFIVEPLLQKMINHLGKKDQDADEVLQKIKKYIQDRYVAQSKGQRANALVAILKYYLSVLDVTRVSDEAALLGVIGGFDVFGRAKRDVESRCPTSEGLMDYDKVLLAFNEKGLSRSVGHYMGLDNKAYQDTVINVLATMSVDETRSLFANYIPFKELEA